MLHKDYDRKEPVEKEIVRGLKGVDVKKDWM
jgi:hypothetical protein